MMFGDIDKTFTDKMMTVLMSTDEKYKFIWRSACGNLYVTQTDKGRGIFFSAYPFDAYNSLFREIKPGCRPIRFRPDVLDDVEKEYLKGVLTPFRDRVTGIEKMITICGNRIVVYVVNENTGEIETSALPSFSSHSSMYVGMEEGREYTLKELGI